MSIEQPRFDNHAVGWERGIGADVDPDPVIVRKDEQERQVGPRQLVAGPRAVVFQETVGCIGVVQGNSDNVAA